MTCRISRLLLIVRRKEKTRKEKTRKEKTPKEKTRDLRNKLENPELSTENPELSIQNPELPSCESPESTR